MCNGEEIASYVKLKEHYYHLNTYVFACLLCNLNVKGKGSLTPFFLPFKVGSQKHKQRYLPVEDVFGCNCGLDSKCCLRQILEIY